MRGQPNIKICLLCYNCLVCYWCLACRVLIEKPGEKRQRGRPSRRWEDSIKTDRKGIVWEVVDWIDLAEGRDN